MICSIVLGAMLLAILGFYALVRLQQAACESGPYHAPMTSPEEWSAALDVALGLDYFSTTEEEGVDLGWSMVPMVDAWRPMVQPTITMVDITRRMRRNHGRAVQHTLAYMCMV